MGKIISKNVKITTSRTKELTALDFENLKGTSLYESLFRNKVTIIASNDGEVIDIEDILGSIQEWIKNSCNGYYFIEMMTDIDNMIEIYFENTNDAAMFELFYAEHCIEIEIAEEISKAEYPITWNAMPQKSWEHREAIDEIFKKLRR